MPISDLKSYRKELDKLKSRPQPFWKKTIGFIAILLVTISVPITYTLVSQSQDIRQRASGNTTVFLDTFDENPPSPMPFTSPNWDIVVNVSDSWGSGSNWFNYSQTQAHHGHDCSAPLATHTINNIYNSVFNCRNHMMTSIEGRGYSAIYLTPNHKVNFQNGEAVIKWDVSSFKASGRQWWDIWIQPYQDNFILPLEDWLPAYSGEPKHAVSIKMEGDTFEGFVVNNFEATGIPKTSDGWKSLQQVLQENGLKPDAARRDAYELRISKNHIKFGIPSMNHYWIDADISPLNFDNGIVTLGHHEYNSSKDCTPNPPNDCSPTTWHWDNVSIEPSNPFTIIRATERGVNSTTGNIINFPKPAPVNSHLRFAAVGTIQLSFDNGATYHLARKVQQEKNQPEHFDNYWTPIPAGTTSVLVKGGPESFISQWILRDPAIFSESTTTGVGSPIAETTVTSVPINTPVPTLTHTPTLNQTTSSPSQTLSVSFDDTGSISGQYPNGIINWAGQPWFLSGPFGGFNTKSISFTQGPTSASFTLLSPRILQSLEVYNGGTTATTISINCAGNTTKTQTVNNNIKVKIDTGFTKPCSTVSISSSNGWDTNFDNFILSSVITGTPIPTSTPTLTPTLAPTSTPTRTPTPTISATSGFTADFNNISGINKPLNGNYPSDKLSWGTNKWYLSAPWNSFKTNSISFNGGSIKEASIGVLTNAVLSSLDIYNGGSQASNITLSCNGNSKKSLSINPNQLLEGVTTGWTTACSSILIGSSNGWDTNFDNFQFK